VEQVVGKAKELLETAEGDPGGGCRDEGSEETR
jgi:hypothetical protein